MYASDLKHPNHSLEDKLHMLYGLNREKTIDLSFRPPFLNLLERFGNPQNHLPPVIHVAGTNGKGSTIAFIRSALEAFGKTAHVYTSPHLQRFNERIVLAGKEIEDQPLESLIDEALALNAGGEVTFFEITTAMALAAFMRTPADYTLLEVGLGGRLDCTNIVPEPAITIITTIGYDHTEYLGETLPEIASEKAGIMKPGVSCVISPHNDPVALETFEDIAREKGVEIHYSDAAYENNALNLIGEHQRPNAALAVKALEVLGLSNDQKVLNQAIKNTKWRARLQDVTAAFETPTEWEIYLDGGHNENAAEALAKQAQKWQMSDDKPLHLILGMMAHKNPAEYLTPLLPYISSLNIVPITYEPKALNPDQLLDILNQAAPSMDNIKKHHNVHSAIHSITGHENGPARILIGGSMYLAGDVLNTISK